MQHPGVRVGFFCGGLFAVNDSGQRFAGSAFYFEHKGRVLVASAAHCLWPTDLRFFMYTAFGRINLQLVEQDKDTDLCLFEPETVPGSVAVHLSDEWDVPGNLLLHTYEYSATEVLDDVVNVNAATRFGNCVRMLSAEPMYRRAGQKMLELSFPALKGASGAPVLEVVGTGMVVHGVLVANIQRHLHPAQIETVLTAENDLIEERKYFLPQGVAVNARHLANMVESYLRRTAHPNPRDAT